MYDAMRPIAYIVLITIAIMIKPISVFVIIVIIIC